MLSPAEFVDSYAGIGAGKAKASAMKLFLLAILAGFYIAMGGAVTNVASHAVANVSAAKIINGLLFPFGLIMVILTGAELFTGNCLIAISVLEKKATLAGMARNLVIVYLGNFVGGLLVSAGMVYCGQLNLSGGYLAAVTIRTAAAKCGLSFGPAFAMGIFCNVLVCAGVVCSLCGKDIIGRAVGAYVPVAFFVIGGFEHCVANMYYIPAGILANSAPKYAELAAAAGIDTSALTWGNFLVNNLVPVTLGNIVGGVALGALLWAAHKKIK